MLRKNSQKIAAIALLFFIVVFIFKVTGGEKDTQPKIEKLKSASLVGVADFQKTQVFTLIIFKVRHFYITIF